MSTIKNTEQLHVAVPLQTKQLVDRLQASIGAGTWSATIHLALALLDLIIAFLVDPVLA